MTGETYAPMDRMAELVPPGAPTVDSAGPALPALLTKMTPCLCTTCNAFLIFAYQNHCVFLYNLQCSLYLCSPKSLLVWVQTAMHSLSLLDMMDSEMEL